MKTREENIKAIMDSMLEQTKKMVEEGKSIEEISAFQLQVMNTLPLV